RRVLFRSIIFLAALIVRNWMMIIGIPIMPERTSSGARPPIRINNNASTVMIAAITIRRNFDGSTLLILFVPVYVAIVYVVESSVVVKKIVAIIINATIAIVENGNDWRIAGIAAISSSFTISSTATSPVRYLCTPSPPSTPVATQEISVGANK